MAVSWLLLILLSAAIAAGVAVATVLLGNRHTRGAARIVATILAVCVFLVVLWRFAAAPTPQRVAESNAHMQHQRTLIENQAAHFDQLAANHENQGGSHAQQLAQQYREQAELTRSQLHDYSDYTVTSTQHRSRAFFMFSPAILIAFLVIVFMLFKHAGPGVGFAALALPLVAMFFGYFSMERRSSYQSHNPPQPMARAEAISVGVEVPPDEIQLSAEADNKAQPAVAEAEDTAELTSVSSSSTKVATSDANETTPEPIEPSPATPAEEIPDWVRQPPKSVPNVHRRVLESSWYGTTDECLHKLEDGPIEAAVVEHLRELAVEDSMQSYVHIPSLRSLGITKRYLREKVIKDEFYETGDFEHQPNMKNLHVLLEFDSRTSDDLLARWRDHARQGTITAVGLGMGGILACLAGVLGLIKLDTYTKGYYTKRLFIGVPAAIIGIGLIIAKFH
ncbi:hypothetical protein [Aeoliella sp.]|uniref:hypothetical protein n=1 Tax=Aeoliella sp. TaxID=2795800 RepID=UPI003CCBAF01